MSDADWFVHHHHHHRAHHHHDTKPVPNWSLTRKTAPSERLITVSDIHDQLRLDPTGSPPSTEEDTLIQAYVDAAIAEIDGADGWLGRALVTQTWQLKLRWFPWRIVLPLPPLQQVDSISYVDTDGATQTVDAGDYVVAKSDSDPAYIEPAYGEHWPATRDQPDAVTVEYTCGFGAASDVPALIRSYALLKVGQLYENRELAAVGVTVSPIPYLRDSLESFRRSVRPL